MKVDFSSVFVCTGKQLKSKKSSYCYAKRFIYFVSMFLCVGSFVSLFNACEHCAVRAQRKEMESEMKRFPKVLLYTRCKDAAVTAVVEMEIGSVTLFLTFHGVQLFVWVYVSQSSKLTLDALFWLLAFTHLQLFGLCVFFGRGRAVRLCDCGEFSLHQLRFQMDFFYLLPTRNFQQLRNIAGLFTLRRDALKFEPRSRWANHNDECECEMIHLSSVHNGFFHFFSL